jgi:hypothetical protein
MAHIYRCEMDLACTYALRRRELALACATRAWFVALEMKRPDLAYAANELMGAL